MDKSRLNVLLVELNLSTFRQKIQVLLRATEVIVDRQIFDKKLGFSNRQRELIVKSG